MFYGIPLQEITKYLENADFKSFREISRYIYDNTQQEYSKRTYSLLNVLKNINPYQITDYLDDDSFCNLVFCGKTGLIYDRFAFANGLYQPSGHINYSRIDNLYIEAPRTIFYQQVNPYLFN